MRDVGCNNNIYGEGIFRAWELPVKKQFAWSRLNEIRLGVMGDV